MIDKYDFTRQALGALLAVCLSLPAHARSPVASFKALAGKPARNQITSAHQNRPSPAETIRGKVSSETGEPLIGVTIVLKGTSTGTSTDVGGNYSLTVPDDRGTLVFSYIGYLSREVPIGNATILNVSLAPDNKALEEVVVVGYGTQKKSDVTGSVVRVKLTETADLPNYNVLQSLQGKAPGLNITSPDRPGEDPGLSIRGINSISAGNSPLVVVDGIIYNGSLSDFNTNDIASVDILKDASAAAVYGSRASNGVILVTTKTGTSEKPQFSFSTYQGFQRPDRLIKVMDGPGYVQKVLDFREATGLEADPAQIDNYLTVAEAENRRNGRTTDWMDHVVRTGQLSNYHLDISGKSKNTNYYMAGTYFKQQGVVQHDNFDRITLNLNLTNNITDWYSVTVKSLFSSQDRSEREASLQNAYRQSPYGNFYNPTGPGGYEPLPVGDPLGQHPFINTLIQNSDIRTSLWGLFSSNLEVPFLPGLKWTLNFSANQRHDELKEYVDNIATPAGQVANGIGTKSTTRDLDWTLDNILNYRKVYGNVHSLDLTLLYSREKRTMDYSYLNGTNFFTQVLGYNNLGLAQVQQVRSNYEDQNSLAYMGRVNYSYGDRYALTLTARQDGFSGFAKNNKYATFPSVALAWTPTNEVFLKDSPWLNYLKVRLSYGKNGNQAISRYQSLAQMDQSQYVFGTTPITTIYTSTIANNDLSWETTLTKNLGLDYEILGRRLRGSVDVYASDTRDILLQRSLPRTSGFGSIMTNAGAVHNQGVELALQSVNLENKKLGWESGLAFSLNRNRIDKLTGEDANGDGIEDDNIDNSWFIGKPLSTIYGYQTNGIYQSGESDIPVSFRPGDFRIADTNQDGIISPEDRTILGNRLPRYTASLSNTVKYGNFSFYMLINAIQGGGKDNYYVGNNFATRSVNAPFTTFTERFNIQDVPYWTPSRPSNDYPRVNYNPSLPHPILEDRSFIRIQDVSLSYNFPGSLLEKMRVNSLRVFASAKNLHTFTKWTGYDPENATTLANFPFLKAYTLGLDFKF